MSEQKRERRVRRVRRPSRQSNAPVKSIPAASKRPSRMVLVTEEELAEEYAYVLEDLRRLFFIAIALFVLLLGLNWAFPFIAPALGLG